MHNKIQKRRREDKKLISMEQQLYYFSFIVGGEEDGCLLIDEGEVVVSSIQVSLDRNSIARDSVTESEVWRLEEGFLNNVLLFKDENNVLCVEGILNETIGNAFFVFIRREKRKNLKILNEPDSSIVLNLNGHGKGLKNSLLKEVLLVL